MNIIGKRLSLSEFEKYVKEKDFGTKPPTFFVIHHTWKPTKADWKGESTLLGIKKYYEDKGWSAGPHLFVAEDGIWLFTDMYDVGIHAGAGNGSLATGYSIGIEVVGDYDNEKWSGETKKNALGAIRALIGRLYIETNAITFHRDWNKSKSCPGAAITKEWLLSELNNNEESMSLEIPGKLKDELEKYGLDLGDNLDEQDLMPLKEAMSKMRDDRNYLKRLNVEYVARIKEQEDEIDELEKRPECPSCDSTEPVPVQYVEMKVPIGDFEVADYLRFALQKFMTGEIRGKK